jgi:3'(2'), 5'-bisphosphate nucleotidase
MRKPHSAKDGCEMPQAPDILNIMVRLAHAAGRVILDVRANGIDVRHKPDASPVTQADTMAETLIEQGLAEAFPGVPVIGEEAMAEGRKVDPGERFFLVDPLDGTKEFVAGRDSFSTNIALVEGGEAIAGVLHAPARGELIRLLGEELRAHKEALGRLVSLENGKINLIHHKVLTNYVEESPLWCSFHVLEL